MSGDRSGGSTALGSRRDAPARPPGDRLGGRLPRQHRGAAGAVEGGTRRCRRIAAAASAIDRRIVRRCDGRSRPGGAARHHPLAAPLLVRLLQLQYFRTIDGGRHYLIGSGGTGDAVADQPRLYRGGNPHDGLARRDAGTPRQFSVDRRRRRCDPGHRLQCHAVRADRRPRTGQRFCHHSRWSAGQDDSLCIIRSALVGREGGTHRRSRQREFSPCRPR